MVQSHGMLFHDVVSKKMLEGGECSRVSHSSGSTARGRGTLAEVDEPGADGKKLICLGQASLSQEAREQGVKGWYVDRYGAIKLPILRASTGKIRWHSNRLRSARSCPTSYD